MNILFLTRSFGIGGVSIVTVNLANEFVTREHCVSIVTCDDTQGPNIIDRLNSKVHCYQLNGLKFSHENVNALKNIIQREKIQIVINQWGLHPALLHTAVKAGKNMQLKYISVYHNAPNMNGKLQAIDNRLAVTGNPVVKYGLNILRFFIHKITAHYMLINYKWSDQYIVLASSYIKTFMEYTGLKDNHKLIALGNPITVTSQDYVYDPITKKREILFVGRLDFYQKKVERIITVWQLLEERFRDWQLTLVGGGPALEGLKRLVVEKNLKRVAFEGFQSPVTYYKRASILILTSEFEGFPLVLPEAMSFGVVPMTYGSFAAVYDIVDDRKNGAVIPYDSSGFKPQPMAERLAEWMKNPKELEKLALAALEKSRQYSMEYIYEEWMRIFNKLI